VSIGSGDCRWYYVIVVACAFMLIFRWNERPLSLRCSMVMVLPNLMLWIYAGNPGELRNWYESIPLLSMFILRNVELIAVRLLPGSRLPAPGSVKRVNLFRRNSSQEW
jgi:hypothetical protein